MLVKIDWTVPQPILLKLSSPSFFGFFRLFFLLQLRWFMRWFTLHFFHCGPSCWRRRRGFRRLLRMCKDITSATSSATVPPIIFECPVNLEECYFIWNASEFCLNCTATHLAQTFITKLLWFLQALFSPPIALVHAPLLPLRTLLLKAPQGFQKSPRHVQRGQHILVSPKKS